MDAFILAAGRGERLRPLTDTTPKPLIDIGGRPIIEHHLMALSAGGFQRVIINLSWLGDKIRQHLGDGSRFGLEIIYSDEGPVPLETAGGLVNALPLIQSDQILVLNADIVCDFDFTSLDIDANLDAMLVMVPNPPHHPDGDFCLDAHLIRHARSDRETLTYAGIGCFRRSLFEPMPQGVCALRPVIDAIINCDALGGIRHNGHWFDIGSQQQLSIARNFLIRKNP